MKSRITTLFAASAAAALLAAGAASAQTAPGAPAAAPAPAAPPAPSPPPYPSMSATISANGSPTTFDAGPLGKLMVDGVLSGGGFYQNNPQIDSSGRFQTGYGDLDNALVMINKADGPVQAFVMAGAYSLDALGYGYTYAKDQTSKSFGFVPEAFIKIVPNSTFNFMIGQLPTVVGDEYTFTFQNINIQRGLLWGQENVFDKGVQVNYSSGPIAISASWNDGFDSDVYNTISGSLGYTFKNSDTLVFAGSGAIGEVNGFRGGSQYTLRTPQPYANSQIYNVIYTHSQGPWMISPYFQYTYVPNNSATRFFCGGACDGSGSTTSGAVLAKYSFTPTISVGARAEYLHTSGSQNLLYYGANPDSDNFSVTVTPTYQKGVFYIRAEASYINSNAKFGVAPFVTYPFGPNSDKKDQFRLAGEAGFVF